MMILFPGCRIRYTNKRHNNLSAMLSEEATVILQRILEWFANWHFFAILSFSVFCCFSIILYFP